MSEYENNDNPDVEHRAIITTDDGILKSYKGTDVKVYSPVNFVEDENA